MERYEFFIEEDLIGVLKPFGGPKNAANELLIGDVM
jgi:hypothetical protein